MKLNVCNGSDRGQSVNAKNKFILLTNLFQNNFKGCRSRSILVIFAILEDSKYKCDVIIV